MKVIGAGLPRTATLTQKVALEMLGFGPCYHMVNVLSDLDLAPQWQEALEGSSDWDKFFGSSRATRRLAGRVLLPGPDRRLPRSQSPAQRASRRGMGTQHGRDDLGALLRRDGHARPFQRVGPGRPEMGRLHNANEKHVAKKRPARQAKTKAPGRGRWQGRWSATTKKSKALSPPNGCSSGHQATGGAALRVPGGTGPLGAACLTSTIPWSSVTGSLTPPCGRSAGGETKGHRSVRPGEPG